MRPFALILFIITSVAFFPPAEARFSKVSNTDYLLVSEVTEVKNLPRIRSQDSLGICFGMSTNVVAQHYYCSQKKLDCRNLTPRQEISPLSTTAYARSDNPENAYPGLESFRNLDFKNGQNSIFALYNMTFRFQFLADSCFPFDQVVQKYGSDERAMNETIARLESLYEKNRKMKASACLDCIQKEVQKSFGVSVTAASAKNALNQETFDRFLYRLTIGKSQCKDVISLPNKDLPYFQSFPKDRNKVTYDQKVQHLRTILKGGRPADLGGICVIPGAKKCEGSHSVAVTGFRKQCSPKGDCRELIRIQNSWGEEWQKQFNDGWVDAKALLDNDDMHVISHLIPRSEANARK